MKMNDALHRMNYSGTLVHIKGEDVNTLKVSHVVEDGVEKEVITSLNGTKNVVSNERTSFSLAKVPQSIESMRKVYSLDVGAVKKVAMRECQIVVARPKDKMRYLQKYCIDKKTGLPLSYSLINNKHKAVERFTFTQVDIEASSDSLVEQAALILNVPPETIQPGGEPSADWEVTELPKGFYFGKSPVSQIAEVQMGENTDHFILTDGLSSISVFISPITTVQPKVASAINSGALNVLTSQKNNHRITLVGEVPRATMQNIFENLKYRGK
jgi:negative regulator of sigma E activity